MILCCRQDVTQSGSVASTAQRGSVRAESHLCERSKLMSLVRSEARSLYSSSPLPTDIRGRAGHVAERCDSRQRARCSHRRNAT